jgi:hypothetical protein
MQHIKVDIMSVSRSKMVLDLVNSEMQMVRGMSMDEMDSYVESLLTRIINGLPDNELTENYNEYLFMIEE